MRTHLIPLTVALTLVSATVPAAAQDTREPACFVVHAADSNNESEALKVRLEATLSRYAPLCGTLTLPFRPVVISVNAILDGRYYYASDFVQADTDLGLRLQVHSMTLHAQTLEELVDRIVTRALDILKSVQS